MELYGSEDAPEREWPRSQQARIFALEEPGTGDLLACARYAPREIRIGSQPRVVLALAAVCTHPAQRGNGFGAQVVSAALGKVDDGTFPVAFFQTGVPGFYEKLGCKTIPHVITNSRARYPGIHPFWNPFAMIYPKNIDWPREAIDILGPGW